MGAKESGWFVPAEPIRRVLQARLDKGDCNQLDLSENIWPGSAHGKRPSRSLTRILGREQNQIEFDLADRILCAVSEETFPWRDGGELEEIYESISLESLDLLRPTCEATARKAIDRIDEAFERHDGKVRRVASELGLSHRTVTVLRERLAEQVAA